MTTEKTITLTLWTFVGKVISLLFNTLSRSVIVFLPRSKRILISWPQLPSALSLEPKRIKSVTNAYVPLSPDNFFLSFLLGSLLALCFNYYLKVMSLLLHHRPPDFYFNCLLKNPTKNPTAFLFSQVVYKNNFIYSLSKQIHDSINHP